MTDAPLRNALLDVALSRTERDAQSSIQTDTGIPGLSIVCATAPGDLDCAVSRPLACLVLQGGKQVTMGTRTFVFGAGDTLLITADVPTVSQIIGASESEPYVSVVLELDPAVIAELSLQMRQTPVSAPPVRVDPTETDVADAALRLMQLLDRPASRPVLQAQRVREFHYWLLAGKHGPEIRRLGWPDSHSQRVARTVAVLRADYARPLRVEQLAAAAGMSPSSFHQHFRAVTSLSPLQFQKQMRLIEARRLMISEGLTASSAAFAVGYESASQFNREYGRLFGQPPARDADAVRQRSEALA
ncbi:AraC family transcriptional regulator [Rhizobium sp. WL3]|uniref:AraC family transcriptional regulator n=1 Tax=Rhizobium sp. WL3 TaxID=2603277 RepID=UPI0011C1E74D|nr:AraC family transcriptional regulator [Rhizobium sp. WL3]QEE44572.1 AraC family transcriptional regulator [Rhizobium sp. WL3]